MLNQSSQKKIESSQELYNRVHGKYYKMYKNIAMQIKIADQVIQELGVRQGNIIGQQTAAATIVIRGHKLIDAAKAKDVAAKLVTAYADNPEKTSKKASEKKLAALTPASLLLTNSILQEFGRSVVESSVQIRHLVTNKLLLETDNPDPRVRIRALELLGKISDVGLFAEKSEVTITHQSTDDLREKLRSKLAKLVNPANEVENAVVIDGEPLNVDEELGLDSE